MDTLTFYACSKIAKKPLTKAYNPLPVTVGEHLRKKRVEGGLTQKEVSTEIGVTEESVMNWENNTSQPQVQFWPGIIKFLGYYPFVDETETIGGVLLMSRRFNGYDLKTMGDAIGVDGTTIRRWELNQSEPSEEMLKRYYEYGNEFTRPSN